MPEALAAEVATRCSVEVLLQPWQPKVQLQSQVPTPSPSFAVASTMAVVEPVTASLTATVMATVAVI